MPPEVAQAVADLRLPGIHQEKEYRRYYPGGEVMAHILGFTDLEDRGQEGIELAFDKRLSGRAGARRVIRTAAARSSRTSRRSVRRAMATRWRCRSTARSSISPGPPLREAMEEHKPKAAAAVVLDVRTGEVLALVNAPTFNPNNRANLTGAQLRKPRLHRRLRARLGDEALHRRAALERGAVRLNTPIDTGNGRMTIGTATISDTQAPRRHHHGAGGGRSPPTSAP